MFQPCKKLLLQYISSGIIIVTVSISKFSQTGNAEIGSMSFDRNTSDRQTFGRPSIHIGLSSNRLSTKWCHDIQHNDIHQNGTQHIDTQYIDTRHIDTQYIDTRHIDTQYIDTQYIDTQHNNK